MRFSGQMELRGRLPTYKWYRVLFILILDCLSGIIFIMEVINLEKAANDLKDLLSNIQTHSQIEGTIVSNINQILQKHRFPLPQKIEYYIHGKENDTDELIVIIKIIIKTLEDQIMEEKLKEANLKKINQTKNIIKPNIRKIHR